jgi:hypothetical protein
MGRMGRMCLTSFVSRMTARSCSASMSSRTAEQHLAYTLSVGFNAASPAQPQLRLTIASTEKCFWSRCGPLQAGRSHSFTASRLEVVDIPTRSPGTPMGPPTSTWSASVTARTSSSRPAAIPPAGVDDRAFEQPHAPAEPPRGDALRRTTGAPRSHLGSAPRTRP